MHCRCQSASLGAELDWYVLDLLSWVHTKSEAAMKAGRVVEGMYGGGGCGGGGGVWGGSHVINTTAQPHNNRVLKFDVSRWCQIGVTVGRSAARTMVTNRFSLRR